MSRPICIECKTRLATPKRKRKDGTTAYRQRCWSCHIGREKVIQHNKKRGVKGMYSYRKHKGPVCERCDFVPEHPCQLDVDHIDGDHSNNDPSNFMTLCANCHRLKTQLNKDWEKRSVRIAVEVLTVS